MKIDDDKKHTDSTVPIDYKIELTELQKIRLVEIGLEAVALDPEGFKLFCEEFEKKKVLEKNNDK